ncbi:MAG: tRNA lysidine(34) synthetase TilS [Planctomycetota bacterium]|nr:tRNA lysidine(34) synthetase TilS [Planctomycetota bacterium]
MARSLSTTVSIFLSRHLPTDVKRYIVALSGGPDSVALLHSCGQWSNGANDRPMPEALHVHHGLRGEEADRDARHCATICGQLRVPLHMVSESIESSANSHGTSIETAGRNARRRRFTQLCRSRSTSMVLTGHHGDDQAETVIGNLLRGCGLRGLRGMEPLSDIPSSPVTIARPLLAIRRSEIDEYLKSVAVEGIEDLSNRSREFRRNRIRLDLIPAMELENPDLVSQLLALSEEARERWSIERRRIQQALKQAHLSPPRISLPSHCWQRFEGPELADLLRQAVILGCGEEGGLRREHLQSLVRLATGESRSASLALPGARSAIRCGGWLHIGPDPTAATDSSVPATDLDQGPRLPCEIQPRSSRIQWGIRWQSLVDTPLTLRTLQPGEKVAGRQATIEETLRCQGVPPRLRHQWPLIEDSAGGRVWFAGQDLDPLRPTAPVTLTAAAAEFQWDLSYHLMRVLTPPS